MDKIKRIQPIDPRTQNDLMAIWESAVAATHSFLTKKEITELIPEVKEALIEVELLYGYYDPTLIGFIGIEKEKVEMLFIDAASRGKGIGTKLLQYALGDGHVRFIDVNEENEKALGFYQHMGFQIIGRSETDEQGNPYPILHLKKANLEL